MGESARLETQAASGCPESSRAAFEVRSMSFDSFGLVSLVACVVCPDAHQSSSVWREVANKHHQILIDGLY